MKYMKRAGIYQASNYNVTFNPKTLEAYSYRWWKFVARIEGKVIFNNYRYSVSTGKHQRKVRSLLEELGVKVDLFLPLPQGINSSSLADLIVTAEEYLCDQIGREELKRQARNEKARVRRAELKARKDAELKANLDALTGPEIIASIERINELKAQGLSIEQIRTTFKAVSHE